MATDMRLPSRVAAPDHTLAADAVVDEDRLLPVRVFEVAVRVRRAIAIEDSALACLGAVMVRDREEWFRVRAAHRVGPPRGQRGNHLSRTRQRGTGAVFRQRSGRRPTWAGRMLSSRF